MDLDKDNKSELDIIDTEKPADISAGKTESANMPPVKKELRHDILMICLTLAAFIITLNVLVIVATTIAVAFDADIQNVILQSITAGGSLTDIINDPIYIDAVTETTAGIMGPAMIISSALAMLWMLIIRGKKLFTTDITTADEKAKPTVLFKLLVLIMGMQFVSTAITYVLNPILGSANLSLTDAMEQGIGVLFATPMGIIATVLIVPVVEEMVFRGAILRKLERYGVNFAIVISSLLFGLYHMILLQSFFAFFVGLLLAYTAVRFSLKWAMLLHIINNGFGALISTLGMSDTVQLAILIACAIGSVIILIAGRKELISIKNKGRAIIAHPYKITFSHPIFIILSVILLGVGFITLAM